MNSFPLPAIRRTEEPTPEQKDPNQPYTAAEIRRAIRGWQYIKDGRFPPTDRAPDPRARGAIAFESKAPAPAVLVLADLNQAIESLPLTLAETVRAVADAGSFGRAARWLRRRKVDVTADYDAAIDLMVVFLSGSVETNLDAGPR